MTPIQFPAPQLEQFQISGTGAILLTEQQRQARKLTVTLEKVKAGNRQEYYNFRVPEPEAFWGYIQLVQRDFIESTKQLQYRRELLLQVDNDIIQVQSEIRCLVSALGALTLCIGASLEGSQDGDGDPGTGDTSSVQDCVPDWQDTKDRNMLYPVLETSAIWYEIQPQFVGFLSIRWSDYATDCKTALERQPMPPAPVPGSGESGPGANDGGGSRSAPPPPPDREFDPLADSPAPPPDSPGGPSVPTSGLGRTKVTTNDFSVLTGVGCNTVSFPLEIEVDGVLPDIGLWTVTPQVLSNVVSCPGFSTTQWQFAYDGVNVGGVVGPAGFQDGVAGTIVSVEIL